MKRLTTHGPATAQAIANRENFNTSGALKARKVDGLHLMGDAGRLSGVDYDHFCMDMESIDYVVTSYATPIAWHTPDGWYVVKQKFSITTTRHQGNLYLIRND